jgi:hypothetical protein
MNDRVVSEMKDGVLEYIPAEIRARAFVQYIESCIEGSLSPAGAKNLTTDDKAALERALNALRPSFDELTKCFFDPLREQKPSVWEHGHCTLWSLIGAAFIAGSRGTVSESAQSYASRANALKSPRSLKKTDRQTKLSSFLQENYSGELVKKTRIFAEIIRPAFLKRLGIEEVRGANGEGYNKKEPTIETIFHDLRAIKSFKVGAL